MLHKIILVLFIGLLIFSVVHAEINTQTITNQLEAELLRSAANDLIRVNISMKESYNIYLDIQIYSNQRRNSWTLTHQVE